MGSCVELMRCRVEEFQAAVGSKDLVIHAHLRLSSDDVLFIQSLMLDTWLHRSIIVEKRDGSLTGSDLVTRREVRMARSEVLHMPAVFGSAFATEATAFILPFHLEKADWQLFYGSSAVIPTDLAIKWRDRNNRELVDVVAFQ